MLTLLAAGNGFTLPVCSQPTQADTISVVQIDSLPTGGIVLDRGWKWQPGNNPAGANSNLNDHRWASIDPTRPMVDLPQLRRAGTGWLRLHLTTGTSLPPTVMAYIYQSVASEIYVDGQLLYRFGTRSATPNRVLAHNPNAAYPLPLRPNTQHLLAVRFAVQSFDGYPKLNYHWNADAIRFTLYPGAVIPAVPTLTLQAAFADTFKIGVAFILFILHLSLFITYRQQPANLYAAIMYLLLVLTLAAKAGFPFTPTLDTRLVLRYTVMIDAWIPALTLLTLYALFDLPRGWLFWIAVASIALRFFWLPSEVNWLNTFIDYYLPLERIRVAVIATRRNLLGARIVLAGVLIGVFIWIFFNLLPTLKVPFVGNEWLYHGVYLAAFLSIPLMLSLYLALEHGWTIRQLTARLQEVEALSTQNQDHEREKQQLLIAQNETLERQVGERTQALRQQAEELRTARDQLSVLGQQKDRFFNNLTHEFRTPLSLILSPVEKLLGDAELPARVTSLLTVVNRNARQLLSLINQLLDLSKLDAGQMKVSVTATNLIAFLDGLVGLFRHQADVKGVTLDWQPDTEAEWSRIDTDKWTKIMTNLLANALKYTPQGGQVSVRLRVAAGQASLTVADTGVGIAPEKLPYVFDRFYQADDSPTRRHEGTGIGLSLVKELTDLLKGTVYVESEVGRGTTVRLILPVEPVGSESPSVLILPVAITGNETGFQNDTTSLPVETDEPTRVLVVEDNAELREFIGGELAADYRVLLAANGVDAWNIVRQELPDLVVSDVMMPLMDGVALTKRIKTDPLTNHIAVVLLTARTAHESRLEGLGHGADDYLTKPFHTDELQLRLRNLLTRRQQLQAYFQRQLAGDVNRAGGDVNAAAPTLPNPFLETLYERIEARLDDSAFSVEHLAREVGMSRRTLHRKLIALTNLSPQDFVFRYRLRRAADLLRDGRNVSETAYLVGYESPSHFSTMFKGVYGQIPSEFVRK